MNLANRLKAIKPSPTLALNAKAKALAAQGVDVVSLAAGEPDFDTPEHIKQAAVEALRQGFTKYTPTAGIPELREAIAAKTLRDSGYEVEPAEVLVTNGGKQAVYEAFAAVLDEGDAKGRLRGVVHAGQTGRGAVGCDEAHSRTLASGGDRPGRP